MCRDSGLEIRIFSFLDSQKLKKKLKTKTMKRKYSSQTDSEAVRMITRRIALRHDFHNEQWNKCKTKHAFKKGNKHVWFILRHYDLTVKQYEKNSRPLNVSDVLELGSSGVSAWHLYMDKDLTLRNIADKLPGIPFLLRDVSIDPRRPQMKGWARLNSIHSDQDVDEVFLNTNMSIAFVIALDFMEGVPQAGPSAGLPLMPKEASPKKKQKTV